MNTLEEQGIELTSRSFDYDLDTPYNISLEVEIGRLSAQLGDTLLEANDIQ